MCHVRIELEYSKLSRNEKRCEMPARNGRPRFDSKGSFIPSIMLPDLHKKSPDCLVNELVHEEDNGEDGNASVAAFDESADLVESNIL